VTTVTAAVEPNLYSNFVGSITAGYPIDAEGECAMSDYQDVCAHGKDPAISEARRRTNWFIIQTLVMGIMLGIAIRAAWKYGIISSLARTISDLSAALWVMIQDSAAAWGDFFQFVLRSMNN
jgi:hypothetical protein